MDDNKKQQLLLEYLISSVDTFARCKGIIKAEYFNPEWRKTVDFLHSYYDKYSATPTPEQIGAETGVDVKARPVTRDQVAYCSDEVETFCRRRAVQQAILAAPKMIAEGNYGQVEQMIRDAITVSLHRELGLSYFDNPLQRLEAASKLPQRISTLWPEFDDLIGGGLARQEVILFSANSGGGKSIVLANLALNFLCQPKHPNTDKKMDVVYISLELSEELIAQRFDMMLTGIPTVAARENYQTIAGTVIETGKDMGRLTIKYLPSGSSANDIRAYLKEFELTNGYLPDMLVVDYLDIMGANGKVSAENVSEKDKQCAEQLRNIVMEYKMFGATASQQNRSAIDAQELNHSHIAGGLTKINTVDWYVSIIMTAAMKAAGDIGFAFLKTRSSDGVGKTIYLKWDNSCLRVRNMPRQDDDDVAIVNKISAFKNPNPNKKSLLDTFDVD